VDHEAALIKAFVRHNRQERYLQFVSKPKTRAKFLGELAHFGELDWRYARALATNWSASGIVSELVSRGAPQQCWVTSEDARIDGKSMPLGNAVGAVLGSQMGTFLSCIPGRLAYFENEDGRWILERPAIKK
jgi:hypothetical protein